jgi:hypothetical protein
MSPERNPVASYRKVVLSSGHMIDTVDRPSPRFPPGLEPAVAHEIESVLDGWDVGPADLLLLSGARGSDILFAESGHRRGAHVELILASAPEVFEQTSVTLPRSIWSQRFHYLLAHHPYTVSMPAGDDGEPNEFARANRALFRRAEELVPPAELCVALVWDEQPAGGPGGTGEFASLAASLDAPLAIINPTKL